MNYRTQGSSKSSLRNAAHRGVFRQTEPVTQDIYSWVEGDEALYLVRGTDGTQFEAGLRQTRSTSAKSTFIVAPSVVDTFDSGPHYRTRSEHAGATGSANGARCFFE